MLELGISGIPVVNENSEIVGIVSEGDLLRHETAGIDAKPDRSRWVEFFMRRPRERAAAYVKQRARTAGQFMTRNTITVPPDTTVKEIAQLMERHAIKRLPVLEQGKIVGIVSRANLLREVSARGIAIPVNGDDDVIRDRVSDAIHEPGATATYLGILVEEGDVDISGIAATMVERDAILLAVKSTSGVGKVNNKIRLPIELSKHYDEVQQNPA